MSTLQESDYCFVILDPDGRSVVMEVRPYEDTARQYFSGVWHKLSQAVQKHHQLGQGEAAPGWTTWKPGDWCEMRRGYEGRQKYVGWCGRHLVGFLNVWPGFPSVHQPDKRVLYVEHLAAAPGNLDTELWVRRFRAVGAALLAYAIFLSKGQGFEGRLGLHVADEPARAFYCRIHEKCHNRLLLPERTGVTGPTPYGAASDASRVYLETTEDGSTTWLEEYHRG